MDSLPEEVFKLLNERPYVTCGAALLSAVYDCPANCRPMQQLLARWGAPAAAAKLVEEWGRQLDAEAAQYGQRPADYWKDYLTSADDRLPALQYVVEQLLSQHGQAAEPADPQPNGPEAGKQASQQTHPADPAPSPARRPQQAQRSAAAAAAAAAAMARHRELGGGAQEAAGSLAALAAAGGGTAAKEPSEEVVDLLDSEEEMPAVRPAQQVQAQQAQQAAPPAQARSPWTHRIRRVAQPASQPQPAQAGSAKKRPATTAAAAAAAEGDGGGGEGPGARRRLQWRSHIASVKMTKTPTAREIELWEKYKPKSAQLADESRQQAAGGAEQQQQQQQQPKKGGVARPRQKRRAGAKKQQQRPAQKQQPDRQPKQQPDESSEEADEESEEDEQGQGRQPPNKRHQVQAAEDSEGTMSL